MRSDWRCLACERIYPAVAGIPDLRLTSDRYLSLEADRAKAERLAQFETLTDVMELASRYYAMTDDVDSCRRSAFLNHLRRAEQRADSLLAALPGTGTILEVGCGSGGLLVAAARAGRAIVGADIALRWLVIARRRLRDQGLTTPIVAASAEQLPWADASFDIVVADSVLEHLRSPRAVLRELARVLRPGGTLVLWSPNRFSLLRDPHVQLWAVGWMPRGWAARYVQRRRGCAWDLNLHSAAAAAALVRAAGFEQIRTAPAMLRGSIDVNPSLMAAYQGLVRNPLARSLLLRFGPLWQLKAQKPGEGQ